MIGGQRRDRTVEPDAHVVAGVPGGEAEPAAAQPQSARELELDEPPKNLGWSAFEGTKRIEGHELDRGGDLVWPVATYEHGEGGGCSVTGGLVYGGAQLPGLVRRYVYGDYCAGTLWSLRPAPGGRATDVRRERAKVPLLAHIGVDGDGELVFASGQGDVYRAVSPAGA